MQALLMSYLKHFYAHPPNLKGEAGPETCCSRPLASARQGAIQMPT